MPVRLTFDKAKEAYESKHPDHKLVKFESATKPCTILCPEYGLIENLGFRSLQKSTFGCPKCAWDKKRPSKRKEQESSLSLDSDALILSLPTTPPKVTTGGAVKRFESKFPNLKLVNFTALKNPCSVYCPKHGLTQNLNYQTLINSKYGCPKCTKEHNKVRSSKVSNQYREFRSVLSKMIPDDKTFKLMLSTINENPDEFKAVLKDFFETFNSKKAENTELLLDASKPKVDMKIITNPDKNNIEDVVKDRNLDKPLEGNVEPWAIYNDISFRVPFFKNIRAASGLTNSDEDAESIFFSNEDLQRANVRLDDVICSRVPGDNMEPILQSGALVAVDTSKVEVENGNIYAFVNENGISCVNTLLKAGNDELKIHSYNSKYDSETVKADSIKIVGKVFWSSALM